MKRLVGACLFEKGKGNAAKAAELLEDYFDLCDHLLDQGYAEGNNNISCRGIDVTCITTLREELAATGRLRDMLLAGAGTLHIGGDILVIKDWSRSGYSPRNTDLHRDYQSLMCLTALLPDEAERFQRLRAFTRALSRLCDPALGEPYAWDGTAHHHPMFHLACTSGVFLWDALAVGYSIAHVRALPRLLRRRGDSRGDRSGGGLDLPVAGRR
jgi:hypothetical protein